MPAFASNRFPVGRRRRGIMHGSNRSLGRIPSPGRWALSGRTVPDKHWIVGNRRDPGPDPRFRAILVPTNPADINLQTDTVRGSFSAGREHRPRASSARSPTREHPRWRVARRCFGGCQGGYPPTGWGRDLATHAILVRRFSLVDGSRAPVAVFQPRRGEWRAGPRCPEPDLRASKVTPRGGLGR